MLINPQDFNKYNKRAEKQAKKDAKKAKKTQGPLNKINKNHKKAVDKKLERQLEAFYPTAPTVEEPSSKDLLEPHHLPAALPSAFQNWGKAIADNKTYSSHDEVLNKETGYAIGYRSWVMDEYQEEYYLSSRYVQGGEAAHWDVNITAAECNLKPKWAHPNHEPPVKTCHCGLYAYHHPQDLLESLDFRQEKPDTMVVGAIIAWGKTGIYEEGIKSKFMRPICFVRQPWTFNNLEYEAKLKKLSARYQVPIIEASRLQEFASSFGENHDPRLKDKKLAKKAYYKRKSREIWDDGKTVIAYSSWLAAAAIAIATYALFTNHNSLMWLVVPMLLISSILIVSNSLTYKEV